MDTNYNNNSNSAINYTNDAGSYVYGDLNKSVTVITPTGARTSTATTSVSKDNVIKVNVLKAPSSLKLFSSTEGRYFIYDGSSEVSLDLPASVYAVTFNVVSQPNVPYDGAAIGDSYLDFIYGNPEVFTDTHIYVPLPGLLTSAQVGIANGVASLGADGKIPKEQIPDINDNIIEGYYYSENFYEDAEHQFIIDPEVDMIYVDIPTERSYRWSGSAYIDTSALLMLGHTSTTAFPGDEGFANTQNIQALQTQMTGVQGDITSLQASQLVAGDNIEIDGNVISAENNTTYWQATPSTNWNSPLNTIARWNQPDTATVNWAV